MLLRKHLTPKCALFSFPSAVGLASWGRYKRFVCPESISLTIDLFDLHSLVFVPHVLLVDLYIHFISTVSFFFGSSAQFQPGRTTYTIYLALYTFPRKSPKFVQTCSPRLSWFCWHQLGSLTPVRSVKLDTCMGSCTSVPPTTIQPPRL
jgi:hypothetical protein